MRASGLFDIALLVSVTGQEHFQERVPVPAAIAAGHVVDLTITPLADGAVTLVFEDVTLRTRATDPS